MVAKVIKDPRFLDSHSKNHRVDTDSRELISALRKRLVSGGYPEQYEKGKEIYGLDTISDSILFHAGAKYENGKVKTNGGRVIAVTSMGDSIKQAISKSYESINKIKFDKMNYRKDIGFDL